MNPFSKHTYIQSSLSEQVIILFLLLISIGSVITYVLREYAQAANLVSVKDTLTTSNLNVLSGHAVQFTSYNSITAGQTIKIGLDPVGSLFTEAYSLATTTDFAFYAGGTSYSVVSTCTAGAQVSAVGNYNNGSDENLTLTLCAGNTIAASSTVLIGIATTTASTKVWTNPNTINSYRITVGGTQVNSGETRVAVLPNVTLTASVNTAFTFVVTGLATTTGLFGNLATTTASSSPTSLPFSTLASGTPVLLAQQLNVTTNARNGFSVTVQENQPPTSSTGATIDLFNNGATTTVPATWVAPTAILDVPSTYGHFGITSDDTDENSTGVNEYGTGTKWAGNIDQPRVVFTHSGPSDGVTQNKGTARVGYRIQISDLQEAGNDYTNTITYVATPTF